MPRVRVDWDERYPDYCIVSNGGKELELTAEELAFIRKADKDYIKAQNILARVRSK